MKRTKLRIKFLKHRNNYTKNESNKQHTYYVSCQKIKIVIMKKKLQIMKLFGRPLNHFQLTKASQDEVIESEIINTVQIRSTFFSNIVCNLRIAEWLTATLFQITSMIQALNPLQNIEITQLGKPKSRYSYSHKNHSRKSRHFRFSPFRLRQISNTLELSVVSEKATFSLLHFIHV